MTNKATPPPHVPSLPPSVSTFDGVHDEPNDNLDYRVENIVQHHGSPMVRAPRAQSRRVLATVMHYHRERSRFQGTPLARGSERKRRRKLSLAEVEQAFGPLKSLDDAARRVERIGVWVPAGLMPGVAASAACRSCGNLVESHEAKVTAEVVEDLKREVKRLKAEIKERRGRHMLPSRLA